MTLSALLPELLPESTAAAPARAEARPQPFDLADDGAYRRWRAWKLAHRGSDAAPPVLALADPRELSAAERDALRLRIASTGCAVYRSPIVEPDSSLPRRLAAQLGVLALDANWLADSDGISRITVSTDRDDAEGRGGFIPYTERAIGWHTDGYYHPAQRRIRTMMLHCVQAAASGGDSAWLDPELAYIALRDEDPALVRALMQPDAMTIPARNDEHGVVRAAQSGPVFSLCLDGHLHMRYTARTRSVQWKEDAATGAATARLAALLEGARPQRLRLEPGMGLVGHNVLHTRTAFVDDAARPRLLYRARFLDRIGSPHDEAWR